MKQDRKPSNKTTHLQQLREEYTVEKKTVFSESDAGETGQLNVKNEIKTL